MIHESVGSHKCPCIENLILVANSSSKAVEVDKHRVVGILPDHWGRTGSDSAGYSSHAHSLVATPAVRHNLMIDTLVASGASCHTTDPIPETERKKAIAARVLPSDPLYCP